MVGDSIRVSFKWVVIFSTKQEAAHTQNAKVSTCYTVWHFRDWSLIMGRGATKWQGEVSEVLPLQKRAGGAKQNLAVLKKGEAQKVLR